MVDYLKHLYSLSTITESWPYFIRLEVAQQFLGMHARKHYHYITYLTRQISWWGLKWRYPLPLLTAILLFAHVLRTFTCYSFIPSLGKWFLSEKCWYCSQTSRDTSQSLKTFDSAHTLYNTLDMNFRKVHIFTNWFNGLIMMMIIWRTSSEVHLDPILCPGLTQRGWAPGRRGGPPGRRLSEASWSISTSTKKIL
jgi:hypothetical protein